MFPEDFCRQQLLLFSGRWCKCPISTFLHGLLAGGGVSMAAALAVSSLALFLMDLFPSLSTQTLTRATPSKTDQRSLIPTGLAHVGLFAWADEVVCFMLVLGVVRSLCPVLCDCSSFIFYQKRREDFRFPINSLPFILWSSVWYKEERLGKQDENRVLLLSRCFPHVFSKQQWAYLFHTYA